MENERRLYLKRQCKPFESLSPDDPRNVDLDVPDAEGRRARGWDWVERIFRIVCDAQEPVCEFITGLSGNGKSTDLKKIAAKLRDQTGACYYPVIIDADSVVDLASSIDITYVLFSILYEAERTVLMLEHGSPEAAEDAMKEGFFRRVWTFLTETDVTLTEARFSLENVAELTFEMRSRASLRKQVREVVASHLTTILAMARDELTLIEGRFKEAEVPEGGGRKYDGLVIIYDSLEKLAGTEGNWREVRDSALHLFSSGRHHLRLPVHVVYTVPPSVVLMNSMNISYLPMMRIREESTGAPFELGVDVMRSIVRKRIPDADLEELLGEEAEDRISEIIQQSGGDPRYVIHLLYNMLSHRPLPLDCGAFRRFLNEAAENVRRTVFEDDFQRLREVEHRKSLLQRSDEQSQRTDRLLMNGVILRYLNDHEWYDLHPSVRPMLELDLGAEDA